jgi:hypothetical protein
MALVSCVECGGKVSDAAATCPHCGVAVAMPLAAGKKAGRSWWKWVLGVPVGLFALVMVVGLMNSNPEKSRARDAYELCMKDLASADRARSGTGAVLAGMCEKMRQDFVAKYHVSP